MIEDDEPLPPVLTPSNCRPLAPFPEANRYEDKLEAKRERLAERAAKTRGIASSAFAAVDRIADGIPMGQPVLVGHHSERRSGGSLGGDVIAIEG